MYLWDRRFAGEMVDIRNGNAMLIKNIPVGTPVHNIELTKGRGGQIAKDLAGNQAMIVAKEEKYVQVKMPSGEIRRILNNNYATIGQLSNIEWKDRVFRKAGTKRHMGITIYCQRCSARSKVASTWRRRRKKRHRNEISKDLHRTSCCWKDQR